MDFVNEIYKVIGASFTSEYVNRSTYLPNDVDKVIMKDSMTIVVLKDGRKGIAKCSHEDEYCEETGFVTAYYKAKFSRLYDLKQVLKNCNESANKKGYSQAILKNK